MSGDTALPTLTWPAGHIDTLSPAVAWQGEAQDGFEVRICESSDPNAVPVWQSGIVEAADARIQARNLPPSKKLAAFVRIRHNNAWSDWSRPASFTTPDAPVVALESPVHAGRARGPEVRVRWRIEPDSAAFQELVVDGETLRPDAADRERVLELAEGVHSVRLRVFDSSGRTGEATSQFFVHKPDQFPAGKLYTLDLRPLQNVDVRDPAAAAVAFETLHAVAALQGLVNRDRPRLYIYYTAVDEFWLSKLREKGRMLEHVSLEPLENLESAVQALSEHVRGVVVWDLEVPATSSVASTICGCESLLPVRRSDSPASLYSRLVSGGPKLPVVRDLTGTFTGSGTIAGTNLQSTGSAKCDAYLWAKTHYLDNGKCDPTEIGYYCDAFWLRSPADMSLDNVGLTNGDYIVARRGFFCDLNVWADEAPRDDPDQRHGLDRETLQAILESCWRRGNGAMIHFCGFTPWAMKYTNVGSAGGTHDAVPTEWETARLGSAYNAYMDADAIGYVGMANASVFAHSPLPDRLVQNPPPTPRQLRQMGYLDDAGRVARHNFVYHYLGDYDSAAWMYHRTPELWRSPLRGKIPAGYAFNPNLSDRLPIAFDWFYETLTPRDYLIAGDCGAGYLNPTVLLPPREPSGLPSGAAAWVDHNTPYYRRFNYSITGFLINGFCGRLTPESIALYRSFSGDGVMTQMHWMPESAGDNALDGTMPVAGMKQDITAPVDVVVDAIVRHGKPGQTDFLSFRSILVGPEWIETVNERIRAARPDCRFEPVDPYTYFYLLRHTLGGSNSCRATYTFDTVPREPAAGSEVEVAVGARNDGWDTWRSAGDEAVALRLGFAGDGHMEVPLPHDVSPGEGVVVNARLRIPRQPGAYTFNYEMVRAGSPFSAAGDMPWSASITATSARGDK